MCPRHQPSLGMAAVAAMVDARLAHACAGEDFTWGLLEGDMEGVAPWWKMVAVGRIRTGGLRLMRPVRWLLLYPAGYIHTRKTNNVNRELGQAVLATGRPEHRQGNGVPAGNRTPVPGVKDRHPGHWTTGTCDGGRWLERGDSNPHGPG